jgi:hypothetical protein
VLGSFKAFTTNNPLVEGILFNNSTQTIFIVSATDGIFRDHFEGGSSDAPCVAGFSP